MRNDMSEQHVEEPQQQSPGGSKHSSFHLPVVFPPEEVARLASEVQADCIHDVHLSLFIYWICSSRENYEQAVAHLRELSLDQSYNTSRISNPAVRQLVDGCYSMRPCYDRPMPETLDPRMQEVLRRVTRSGSFMARLPRPPSSTLRFTRRFSSFDISDSEANIDSSGGPVPSNARSIAPVVVTSQTTTQEPHHYSSLTSTGGSALLRPRMIPRAASLRSASSPVSTLFSPSQPSLMEEESPREYPPNTPDRPAPLKVRSHGSSSAATPNRLPTALRSVSTPTHRVRALPVDATPSTLRAAANGNLDNSPASIAASTKTRQDGLMTSFKAGQLRDVLSSPPPNAAARRAAAQARREAQQQDAGPDPLSRPLPLRHYESAGNLGTSSHTISTVVTQPGRCPPARSASQAFRLREPLPSQPQSSPARNVFNLRSSLIPPQPLSARPMLVQPRSAIAALSQAVTTVRTSEDDANARAVSSDDFREVTEAHLSVLLERTRNSGALRTAVDPACFPQDERVWRVANSDLIGAIFGRHDIVLSLQDAFAIDNIARELKGVMSHANYDWVRAVFDNRAHN